MDQETNRCAWMAWDTEYPADGGSWPVFAADEASARVLALELLGYDLLHLCEHDIAPSDAVTLERAPHLDAYAAAGEVPEGVPLWPPHEVPDARE